MQGRLLWTALLFLPIISIAKPNCEIHIYNRTDVPVTFITGDDRLIGSTDAQHRWVETRHLCLDEKPIVALTAQGHAVSKMHYWVTPTREALLTYPDSFHPLIKKD